MAAITGVSGAGDGFDRERSGVSVELPLIEIYDMVTSSLIDNHREIIRDAVVQILEDTMWITPAMMMIFVVASVSIFDIRADGTTVSLRAAVCNVSLLNPLPVALLLRLWTSGSLY